MKNKLLICAMALLPFLAAGFGGDAAAVLPFLRAREEPAIQPIASYMLDGNADDASDNGLDGAWVGTEAYGTGVYGQAADLNGTDASISIDHDDLFDVTDEITVLVWAYSRGEADYTSVLVKGGNSLGAGSRAWELYRRSDGTYQAFINGNALVAQGDTATALETWVHIAFRYDGAALTLYVDGESDKQAAGELTINENTSFVSLGFRAVGTTPRFSGLLDEARIYGRALSLANIQRVMDGKDAIESLQ